MSDDVITSCDEVDAFHGSLRIGGCMNDEPVVLFQLSNPVLDVSGRVAVSMLVSNSSDSGDKPRPLQLSVPP
jgi:hypothetical protein